MSVPNTARSSSALAQRRLRTAPRTVYSVIGSCGGIRTCRTTARCAVNGRVEESVSSASGLRAASSSRRGSPRSCCASSSTARVLLPRHASSTSSRVAPFSPCPPTSTTRSDAHAHPRTPRCLESSHHQLRRRRAAYGLDQRVAARSPLYDLAAARSTLDPKLSLRLPVLATRRTTSRRRLDHLFIESVSVQISRRT